jgi:hypothetical protein
MPAGSSRALRLDPLALPVSYTAKDAGADERTRQVVLDRERVVLRRAVRGIRMAVKVPVAAFRGISIRLLPADADGPAAFAIMLEHRDAALSVPLFVAPDNDDVVAEWQLWARVLGLPLLIADADGSLHSPYPSLGVVRVGEPSPRRRRRTAIKRRRASAPLRRATGRVPASPTVHRGEREIIARN